MTRSDGLGLACAFAMAPLVLGLGPSLLTIGLPTAVLLLLLVDGVARPASRLLLPTVSHGPRQGGRVALTFDDGPDAEVTPRILDALAAAGARGTFFCIGRHLQAQPELAARLVAEGHELGNHSFGHSRLLNFRGPRGMEDEIGRGEVALAGVGAVNGTPPLYRPPIGLKNPPLARVAAKRGLTVVTWSLHGWDNYLTDPERLARRILRRIRPGDIVLLHDGCDRNEARHTWTAEALPLVLEGLAAKGLECVTVSTLLGLREQAAAPGYSQMCATNTAS